MLSDYEAADHSQIISLLRHIKLSASPAKKIEKNKYLKNVQANISLDIHIGKEAAGFKLELRGLKWVVIQK